MSRSRGRRLPLILPLQVKPPTHSGAHPEDFSVLRRRGDGEEPPSVPSVMSMLIATQQIDTTTSKMVRMERVLMLSCAR